MEAERDTSKLLATTRARAHVYTTMKAMATAKAKEMAAAGAARAVEASAKAVEASQKLRLEAKEMGARAALSVDVAFTEVYNDLPDDALGPLLLSSSGGVFKGSELMRMHSLCDASYGSRWEGDQEIEGCDSVRPWEEIHYNATHNLRVIGTVNDDHCVEIAFRGTVVNDCGSRSVRGVGVDNALIDVNSKLVAPAAEFFGEAPGRALLHRVFQDAYRHLSGPVSEWLKNRGVAAGATLRIGGHSLGGALATLAFLELSLQGYAASLVSFGCPRTGNADFAAWVRADGRHSLVARIVNAGDPITMLPPHVIRDTFHTFSHVRHARHASGNRTPSRPRHPRLPRFRKPRSSLDPPATPRHRSTAPLSRTRPPTCRRVHPAALGRCVHPPRCKQLTGCK